MKRDKCPCERCNPDGLLIYKQFCAGLALTGVGAYAIFGGTENTPIDVRITTPIFGCPMMIVGLIIIVSCLQAWRRGR